MPRKLHDWNAVQAYHDEGHGFVECAKCFGFCHTAWIKAIKRGALKTTLSQFSDRRRKYDWSEVQAYYDAGHTYAECKAHFGFSYVTWAKAVKSGRLSTRPPFVWTAEEALAKSKSRLTIKRHLLKAGIIVNRCDLCGLSEWRGHPLSIQIDHVNGIRDDHRLENLRMLCPNCHSQTDTFAARNIKSNGDPGSSNGRTAVSDIAYRGSSP